MKLLVLAVLTAAALSPALPAAAQGPTDRSPVVDSCFLARDVGARSVVAPNTLYFKVKDGPRVGEFAFYRVETAGRCNAGIDAPTQRGGFLVGSHQIGGQVCKMADLRIRVGRGPDCDVVNMTRITRTEVAELPRRLRP